MKDRARFFRLSDEELLRMRLKDLDGALTGDLLSSAIATLSRELGGRGFRFRPHAWVSDEWFCPDGVAGFAVPFYLTHPRLLALERRFMHEAEGGTTRTCLRLLRHETGHALDNAYRLRRRRRRRELFGPPDTPYPETYLPQRFSRRFVRYLEHGYAQSHPDEDFAETFAVWLDPASRWRKRYARWPAFDKLAYMDELMKEIAPRRPLSASRDTPDRIETLSRTLREHYRERRKRYRIGFETRYDAVLDRLFARRGRLGAAAFLERHRSELRRLVSVETGVLRYIVDDVLKIWIARARARNLFVRPGASRTLEEVVSELASAVTHYVRRGYHRVPL